MSEYIDIDPFAFMSAGQTTTSADIQYIDIDPVAFMSAGQTTTSAEYDMIVNNYTDYVAAAVQVATVSPETYAAFNQEIMQGATPAEAAKKATGEVAKSSAPFIIFAVIGIIVLAVLVRN